MQRCINLWYGIDEKNKKFDNKRFLTVLCSTYKIFMDYMKVLKKVQNITILNLKILLKINLKC